MAHRTRIRANLAAWANNSAVLNTEYDAIDAAQFSAIDGDAGGSWSPAAKIVIGGTQGVDCVAPVRALGASDFSAATQASNWSERSSFAVTGLLNTRVPICWDNSAEGTNFGNLYVMFAAGGTPYRSGDGNLWTAGTPISFSGAPAAIAAGLAFNVPVFMVVDVTNGAAYTSTDGNTWTARGTAGTGQTSAICYSPSLGLWVVAGFGTISTAPQAAASTWTARTVPASWTAANNKQINRIVWNGALFVATTSTSHNEVLTSPDGVTWTVRAIGATDSWNGLAWGAYDGIWMITGATHVYKSTNGTAWSDCVPTPSGFFALSDLAVRQSLWIGPLAGGNYGGVGWSVDAGTTWRNMSVGDHHTTLQGYSSIIVADNRLVMARSSASVLEAVMSVRSF